MRHVETSSRAITGEYNPDLRNPLPNATYTVDGRFHYTTDGWARTVRLEVDRFDIVGDAFRSRAGHIQSKVNKYGSDLTAQHHRKYEGGHIVGHQFGGPPEEINMVVMLEEVNKNPRRSTMESYKKFEQDVAANPDGFNKLVIDFQYPDPVDPTKLTKTERVPSEFQASWKDASGGVDAREFKNVPPRKQDGVN